jgi:DEAD/DEAH box helicase domain-containing protein
MVVDPAQLLASLDDEGQLVHLELQPARAARWADSTIDPTILAAFEVPSLWTHQAQALDLIRAGRSTVVATSTASGKSLCYQAAILEAARAPTPATALCIFPTKALANDQLRTFVGLREPKLVAATYDGDTSVDARTWARRHANVLLTNPEMLHGGLLPYHGRWATFLRRLRYVVIDELHVLRGIFGTHVGHVLRRLRRLCEHYGSSPTFVFSSATIGEPEALASALCGVAVVAVTDDGSPRGERYVALWNPPLLDAERGIRGSSGREVSRLMARLVADDTRTVAFCRSRRATERVTLDVRSRVEDFDASLVNAVRAYRSGYLASERREIEAQLFDGRLLGVVATSALELGVDIGGLDACLLNGFPGTISSMWQQIGRAGRSQQRSLAVLVAGNDQLDQWFMANPKQVFLRSPEPAVVNLANPYVLHPHLACAAFELPLSPQDDKYWPDDLADAVREMTQNDQLRVRDQRAYWSGRGSPASGIGLRSGSAEQYRITCAAEDNRLVGTVDGARAFDTVHQGAIYVHQGQQYRVNQLDLEDREARVEPVATDEYTMARTSTDIAIASIDQHNTIGPLRLHLGSIEVTNQVTGYERRESGTGEVIERVELDLPPRQLVTRAFWYTIDDPSLFDAIDISPDRVGGTLHAMEHAAIGMLPLFTICDRWDVGGLSTPYQPDTGRPTIFIYDGYPGGAGIAELGYGADRGLLDATVKLIEQCPCRSGCPSCVQSPKCGNGNEPLDKSGSIALLRAVLM